MGRGAVVLVQDRPVPGGNGSSGVRLWILTPGQLWFCDARSLS
jgi:hypothetical protein